MLTRTLPPHLNRCFSGAAVLLLLAIFALTGCSKSVEGETKRWDQNKLRVQEYEAKYPGFKQALRSRLAEADKDMKAAVALSGDAKTSAMDAANDKISDMLYRFSVVERKMRELSGLRRDRDLSRLPMGVVRPALDNADAAGRRTMAMLKGSNPANAGEAIGRLKSAERLLDKALAPLKNLKKKVRSAKSKARKAKRARKATGTK